VSYNIKIKKLPKSEVEIEVSVPAEALTSARKKAVDMFSASLEIPGFRKGHVPENVVLEKAGEAQILEEATDIILKEHFLKIIEQEKLDIIGRPKISVTKLALGNPFEFKATFAVMPEIELPDYRKIAASSKQQAASKEKKEDTEASEKEIEDVLLQIRRNKAHFDWHNEHKEETGHNHPEINDGDLPVLDDKFAQVAGNFKNLDELKSKVKENIINEKKIRNMEKKRAVIMEALLKNTKIELPDILVESEIEKSLAQMKDDVARMGAKFEDYLSQIKKSEEDLKKDFRESSEKKAGIQIIFNKIAETEKIEPNKEILENEIKEVMKHYPAASELNARVYVSTILTNSEVLKLLEKE
jgi:trigger factor